MVFKRLRKAIKYGRAAYSAYRTARRFIRRRRKVTYRRSMPVSTKAVTSKRYAAKMNKLYHVGRILNLLTSVPLFLLGANSTFYIKPSSGVVIPLLRMLPLEMFYLKRYY